MQTNEEDIKEKLFHEQSCLKCAHFTVCYYFRAVQQVVALPSDDENAKKFQPFKPDAIAKICRFYAPDLV